MFSTPDRALRTAFGLGLALAAATLPLSHAERASLADPNSEEALLPQAWSVPGWSSIAMTLAPLLRDRALTRPPLVQPPAGQPTLLAGCW